MTTSSARAREEVRRAIRTATVRLPEVFAPGSRLVVAFSGGQDSTTLLHALANSHRHLQITAAHIDHGLRSDSAKDGLRVIELASSIGVECVVRRVDVGTYRKSVRGWSVQQAARAARYRALASIVEERNAAALLVAHTADDQAETLLLNLLRGTALSGLSGMRLDDVLQLEHIGPPVPDLTPWVERVRVVRPLLRVARRTTHAYCAHYGLDMVLDASNETRAYARNRVRLDVLPLLEQFNPAIRAVLARTADLVAEDEAALETLTAELERTIKHDSGYDLARWRALPRSLQRRMLRRGLASLVGSFVDISDSPVEDALDLIQTGQPKQTYHLPYGIELCLGAEAFFLRWHGAARKRSGRNSWDSKASRV